MYKKKDSLCRRLTARRSGLWLVVGLLLLAAGLHSRLVEATADDDACLYYYNVIDTCDSDAILDLWKKKDEADEVCLEEAVRNYYGRCFRLKISNALKACDLKLFLKEEEVVANFKGKSTFPIMREMVRHNKCNTFVGKCFGEKLNRAIEQDDWQSIVEVEKLITSEELKNCGTNSKLVKLVKKARADYFKRWVSQKMVHLVELYDLEEIHRLETFIYKEIQDSPDFQKMLEEFLDMKCRNLNNVLEYTLREGVSSCDLDQIQDIEDLLLFKWKKNCLGYDYSAMENRILQAKQLYMGSCLQDDLKKYASRCDLGRILKLEEVAKSYNARDILQKISADKCSKLVSCLEEELKLAVDSCNADRLQEFETLLDSSFNECANYTELKSLLKKQQQTFAGTCQSGSKAKAQQSNALKAGSSSVANPAPGEHDWIREVNKLTDTYKASPKGTLPLTQISKIISKEFENNILLPPLLNKSLTAYNRQAKFVSLIKTMLDVQQKLEYDRYLDSVLERIATKTFGVKAGRKIILSEARLKWIEDLFKGMDKELRAALSEVNDPTATYKFYTKLYLPLIKINGLLNNIYEYNGEKPFVYFIDSLDKEKLEASFTEFLKFVKTLDFVNAEVPLSKLLSNYYTKRGKNIWKEPDLLLSKNINLPVFINVLMAQEGRLNEAYDFKAILNNLLIYIDNKWYLIKHANYENNKIDYYDNMVYFDFIYNDLLIPLEIKTFSLRDEIGRIIPLGRLVD